MKFMFTVFSQSSRDIKKYSKKEARKKVRETEKEKASFPYMSDLILLFFWGGSAQQKIPSSGCFLCKRSV